MPCSIDSSSIIIITHVSSLIDSSPSDHPQPFSPSIRAREPLVVCSDGDCPLNWSYHQPSVLLNLLIPTRPELMSYAL